MQRSFDDLGPPLADVAFCVVDLETTGGPATTGSITEVGAVKLRGGECLGTLQTLVNPGAAIPRSITYLTGITEAMVAPAPPIEAVLPSFLEFCRGTVIVGHNVRYDLGYLRAALERSGLPPLPNRWVDTCALARRLVRDEVPNCRLATLATALRLPHRPSHRALDDALATGDLLHALLERAAGLGVLGLDDLLLLPTQAGHPQAAKLRLTRHLPRRPGVYLFRDGQGRVLYVGKATDLRSRVRSYFSGDQRRKVGGLLREVQRIDHVVCSSPLEAAVLEVRLIHRHEPRYNRRTKTWRRYAYLKLTRERFPRLSVVRQARADGSLYLGPVPSARTAREVADAIESVVPIRRCTARPGRQLRAAPCTPAQLGVATCPCAGTISEADYAALVDRLRHSLTSRPHQLLEPLAVRMKELATTDRFEEAAAVRDRAGALASTLARQRRLDGLRRAGRVSLVGPHGGAELVAGRLRRAWAAGLPEPLDLDDHGHAGPAETAVGVDEPLDRELADEIACVAGWLDREAGRIRIVHADRGLSSGLPPLPSFAPKPTPADRGG